MPRRRAGRLCPPLIASVVLVLSAASAHAHMVAAGDGTTVALGDVVIRSASTISVTVRCVRSPSGVCYFGGGANNDGLYGVGTRPPRTRGKNVLDGPRVMPLWAPSENACDTSDAAYIDGCLTIPVRKSRRAYFSFGNLWSPGFPAYRAWLHRTSAVFYGHLCDGQDTPNLCNLNRRPQNLGRLRVDARRADPPPPTYILIRQVRVTSSGEVVVGVTCSQRTRRNCLVGISAGPGGGAYDTSGGPYGAGTMRDVAIHGGGSREIRLAGFRRPRPAGYAAHWRDARQAHVTWSACDTGRHTCTRPDLDHDRHGIPELEEGETRVYAVTHA